MATDSVHVASLRQQMDRQCKQRRFREPSTESFPRASEYIGSQTYSQPIQAGGVKLEAESQPSNASNSDFECASVQAADHILTGPRSVFDVDAYPENGDHLFKRD
jgi:hypothetical protein